MSAHESLEAVKTQCQAAANAFQQLQGEHPHLPEGQMEFNYAVLLALKGLYDTIEALQ